MNKIETMQEQISSILPVIRSMAQRLVCMTPDVEADDIAQTVALKLLQTRSLLVRPSRRWLQVVTRNAVYDLYRSRQREARVIDRGTSTDMCAGVSEGHDEEYRVVHMLKHPEETIEPDLLPRIKGVFQSLTKPLRQALLLYVDGHTYAEIAQMTNTNLGTVRSRIHYARKKARAQLAEYV
jgi:RNA polymerase sigma-70 factor, ECF subfamily